MNLRLPTTSRMCKCSSFICFLGLKALAYVLFFPLLSHYPFQVMIKESLV